MKADYKKAVQDHMATAPVELREYVCRRLINDIWWKQYGNPVVDCGFDWVETKEGYIFWDYVYLKQWQEAMDSDFWQSREEEEDPLTPISEMEIGQVFTFDTGRWKIVSVENGQAQCERLPDVITLPITQRVPAEQ